LNTEMHVTSRRYLLVFCLFFAVTLGDIDRHATAQTTDRQKKVLAVSSFRRDVQFSVVTERELPRLLETGLGGGVDYYSEYIDTVRFQDAEQQSVFRDFVRSRYEDERLDLIIALGDDAAEFLADNRGALLSDTPVVFYVLDPPPRRMANSTGLVNEFHFGRSIDLALALQPDLQHLFVVCGASAADQRFERQLVTEFRPFERVLQVTYLSGLVAKDLEARLRTLPPRSAVYFMVVFQDGAGAKFHPTNYLKRVAALANAPTYTWADAALESGAVGGNMRNQLAEARAIASLSLRVLGGERPDDIPVSSLDLDVKQVDWRQLRRWGINEARVPAGTTVLFREPGTWERYKRYIIGALILMLAQTALITGLLVQRTKRRHVEVELRGSQAKLRGSYDRIRHLSRRLLGEQEAERARIARELHDDVNQQLAILSIELDRLHSELRVGSTKRLSQALETAQGIATSVRELSHRLHPSRLQLIGIVAGLDSLRRDFSTPNLAITFCHRDVPAEIDQKIALCLFRVAQEALGNAVKHSDARHVSVDLTGGRSSVALTISDDGKGFDVDGVPNAGLGLISMRERVESVGGVLEIHAAPASGTRLRVTIPTQLSESASAGVASV
jgi:signal transduction histidine kinase